jgi:hypothetical protein
VTIAMTFNRYTIHSLLSIVEEIVTIRFLQIVAAGCPLIFTFGKVYCSTSLILGGKANKQTTVIFGRIVRVE